jgi:CelD/BcsL family acetyltransferase involved in cellulose biosynthesis
MPASACRERDRRESLDAAVTMSQRIEWVGDEERLARLAPTWDALAGDGDPFMTHAWLAAWRAAFGAGSSARVCLVWRGEQLVAGLPLMQTPAGPRAMANGQTPSFRPLAADRPALEALIGAALAASGGVLELPMLRRDHPLITGRHRAWRSLYTAHTTSPIIDTVGTFASWRELTRPRWRTPIERLARKMRRDHDAELRLVAVPDDVEATITAGLALEAAGWKGRQGTAIASSPATDAFYRGVARRFHDRGQLRTSTIVLDGGLVAFALCLLHGNRLWQLKIAFDERHRGLAPGLVLHVEAVERCFELGLSAYELLGDRSEWKDKFATSERDYVRFTAYGRGPAPTGRYLARQGGRAWRRARATARGSSLTPGRTRP